MKAATIIYLLSITVMSVVTSKLEPWHAVQVSLDTLTRFHLQTDSVDIPGTTPSWHIKYSCSISCQMLHWCNTWCTDPSTSTTTCLLYRMYIVPGYKGTDLTDAVDCFTRVPRDYAVGATIEGGPPPDNTLKRVKENLVDGIYKSAFNNDCYFTSDSYNPWFKLDLGEVKPVHEIFLVLQGNLKAYFIFDIEVLVGTDDLPESSFREYNTFGYFKGPGKAGEEILMSSGNLPVMVRYVVIQRYSDVNFCPPDGTGLNTGCKVQICHIEIR